MIQEQREVPETGLPTTDDETMGRDVLRAAPIEAAAIFAALAAGVTVQDEHGRLVFANAIAARISGFASPEALLAAPTSELVEKVQMIAEDGGAFAWDRLPGRRVLAGEDEPEPVLVGFRLMPSGDESWSIVEARPVVEPDGRRYVVNTFHDVTPRIEAERRVRESERRYRDMADERQRSEEQAQLLADAALRLDEARNVDEAVDVAAHAPIPDLADWCVIDLLEPDGSLRRAAMAARDPALARLIEPLRDQPGIRGSGQASERALATRASVFVADVADTSARDSELDPEFRRIILATGVRSVIAQPLVARGDVIGLMVFAVGGDRRYEPADEVRTAEMARRVGPAIANTLSYVAEQGARRSAEELASRMEQLQAVTRTLAAAVTRDEVVRVVGDEARRALAAGSVAIGLVEEPDTGDERVTIVGPDRTPVAEAALTTSIESAEAAWIDDLGDEADVSDGDADVRGRRVASRSGCAVPLVADETMFGALWLGFAERRHFAAEDRRLIATFADLAAGALARIRLAENIAARAASAIENARLFREGVRFKRLLDATRDAVLMFDPETGRIDYANQGAADQLRAPVEQLLGTLIVDHLDEPVVVAGDGPSRAAAALAGLIGPIVAGSTDTRTEILRFRQAGGASIPVEIRLQAVPASPGEPTRVLAIARDIRDRIEAEEHLRDLAAAEYARAAELNAVIRAMGEGVFVCSADGKIILSNPAAENVFPDVDEATYADILDQIEDPDGLAPALGRRGGPVDLRARGDEERWVELSTWPVAPEDGPVGGHHDETIVMLRDITEQRQRQVVRDTFIGVLSHELRTPITTIYAGSKVLARSNDLGGDTQREIFADIATEAERLQRLVEDVVAMTRFGEDEGELGAEPVLLQRVLPTVIRSEEPRWPAVDFRLEVPAGLPTVSADPTYVEQVLRNLLSNAAKYGGHGAVVETIVEADDREARVRILDGGPGFPADEQDRLFELFFRSAGTARSAAGAGIGLFVCARLIRAMGGRIWALNRPEGGAEFGFSLRVMTEDD